MTPARSHGHVHCEIRPVNPIAVELRIRHILDEDCLPHGPPGPGHRVRRRVVAGFHLLSSNDEFGSRSPSFPLEVNIIPARGVAEYESLRFSRSSALAYTAVTGGLGILQAIHIHFLAFRYGIGLPAHYNFERMEII